MGVGEQFSSVFIDFHQLVPNEPRARELLSSACPGREKVFSYFHFEDDTVCSYYFPYKWSVDGLRLVLIP